MLCPSCGAEHDVVRFGRFCQACGLSVAEPAIRSVRAREQPVEEKRVCAACGVPAASQDTQRCLACGSRIPLPGGEI